MARIRIQTPSLSATATLNDSDSARSLLEILPVEGTATRWGKEVYFPIPLQLPEENPQPEVPSGALAYWPPGNAFCIFFGQTPYSPVNLLGVLDGDPAAFAKVKDGEPVTLTLVD